MLSLEAFEGAIREAFHESPTLIDTCLVLFRRTCLPPGGPHWMDSKAIAAEVYHGQALADTHDAVRHNLDRLKKRLDDLARQGSTIHGYTVTLVENTRVKDASDRILNKAYRLNLNREGHRPAVPPTQPTQSPYKGLNYYDEPDEAVYATYFSRDSDKQRFLQEIENSKVLAIVGESGVGKSSFIRASLIPHLKRTGALVAFLELRSHDPLPDLMRNLAELAGLNTPQQDNDIRQLLTQYDSFQHRRLVIFLDQVERFVLSPTTANIRDAFFQRLISCLDLPAVDLRLVLSVRTDYASDVSSYFKDDAGLRKLYDDITLHYLTLPQAIRAISLPFEHAGFTVDKALLEHIVNDLTQKAPPQQLRVYPPILQIVCRRVYDRARNKVLSELGSASLDSSDYQQVGDAAQVISDYLQRALRDLGDKAPIATELLKALTTAYRTSLPADDLYPSVDAVAAKRGFSRVDVDHVLGRLENEMIVKRIGSSSLRRYQLVHDCIAGIVFGWMNKLELQAKGVRDMLIAARISWVSADKSHDKLLGKESLAPVIEQLDHTEFIPDDIEFILKSVVKCSDLKSITKLVPRFLEPKSATRLALELYPSAALELRIAILHAIGAIGGEDAVGFLTRQLVSDLPDSSLSTALDSFLLALRHEESNQAPRSGEPDQHPPPVNHSANSATKLATLVADAHSRQRLRLLAHLKEDYSETLTETGENLSSACSRNVNLSIFDRHFLLPKALWRLRLARIAGNRSEIGWAAFWGLVTSIIVAVLASGPSLWIGANLTRGHQTRIYGERGAMFSTILEALMTGVLWGPVLCLTAAAMQFMGPSKPGFARLRSLWPAFVTSGSIAGLWTAGLALFIFGSREPLRVAFPASVEMGSAVLFANTGVLLALSLYGDKPGSRNPVGVLRWCIASLTITQLFHVGYVRLLQGTFFVEGTLFQDDGGTSVRYLTYGGLHVWDDALRAGLAALAFVMVYLLWIRHSLHKAVPVTSP